MRIIAGKYKSRRLVTLSGQNTRPMTDRMKESVFNVIGPYFEGGKVLDLFGGSGALSLESLSRGMDSAMIVEKAQDAYQIIQTNVNNLNAQDQVSVLKMDYSRALEKFKFVEQFDLVFLDPPYRMNIVSELLDSLVSGKLLKKDAHIVCQYVKGNHIAEETKELKIIKHYTTGNSELCIYQFEEF